MDHDKRNEPSRMLWLFRSLTARPVALLLFVLLATSGLGYFASQVKPDYSVEAFFPRHDRSWREYSDYKKDFPYDDARALVVVTADDLFTPAGLNRLRSIESAFSAIDGVVDTDGLATTNNLIARDDELSLEPLMPTVDSAESRQSHFSEQRKSATSEPLFVWNFAPPDGRATTIRVTLTPEHARDEAKRSGFLRAARKVISEQNEIAKRANVQQTLTISGVPVIRSQFTEMVLADTQVLFPAALLVIVLLLAFTFRKVSDVFAAVGTIIVAVTWTSGAMGILGISLQMLTQITPVIVMIVSLSDTVHIVSSHREELAKFASPTRGDLKVAIARACADSAIPCLQTEITIAFGFLALIFSDMPMISEFGAVTAIGMILTWLANVTVLPLLLSVGSPKRKQNSAQTAPLSERIFRRFIGWVEHIITTKPKQVVAVALLVVVSAGSVGWLRRSLRYYTYDDLRDDAPMKRDLAVVERAHGGTVPLAIHITQKSRTEDHFHEPEAVQTVSEIERAVRKVFGDDLKNSISLTTFLRKSHALFDPEGAQKNPLPQNRQAIAQELLVMDDPRMLRDVLSPKHDAAAVFAMLPDRGSAYATEAISKLNAEFKQIGERHPDYRVTITGFFGIIDGIYRAMVGGLATSLGYAILASFVMFLIVLRSWRLALIALVPNLLPVLLTFGVMGALGIDIKPSTVFIFSITLVIADDDTIQYLARYARRYRALVSESAPEPHRTAALETLRESGFAMFVTSIVVSAGFMTLLLSQFVGLANLGLLIGVSLISAVFADLFLTPLMLIWLKPDAKRS